MTMCKSEMKKKVKKREKKKRKREWKKEKKRKNQSSQTLTFIRFLGCAEGRTSAFIYPVISFKSVSQSLNSLSLTFGERKKFYT